MKLKKEKLIEKYNIAFGFFIVAILGILIYNFISLDIFNLRHSHEVTRVYYADNITPTHLKVINLFNEENKGEIEVVPLNLPFTKFTTNERKELLARSLRSDNSLFDIFSVDQIWVSRFAKWAEPLDKYFSREELDRLLPKMLAISSYKNSLVSIPLYIDIGVLFYRQDLVAKLPNGREIEEKLKNSISWSELIELSKRHFPDQYTYVYQGKDFEGLICNYVEILSGMNGELSFTDSTRILDSTNVAAVRFMHDLVHKYQISPPEVTSFAEVSSYRYACQNNIPFIRAWYSSINDNVAFDAKDTFLDKLKLVPLPHMGQNDLTTVLGGWNLMIKKDSEKKDAAVKFLKFVVSDKVQEILFKEANYLFVTKHMYDRTDLYEFEGIDLRNIVENHAIHRPVLENYTKLSDIYSYYLNLAISGKVGSEVALENIVSKIFSDEIFIK